MLLIFSSLVVQCFIVKNFPLVYASLPKAQSTWTPSDIRQLTISTRRSIQGKRLHRASSRAGNQLLAMCCAPRPFYAKAQESIHVLRFVGMLMNLTDTKYSFLQKAFPPNHHTPTAIPATLPTAGANRISITAHSTSVTEGGTFFITAK